jgi:predicted AAA+ superfamily ATPase
MLERSSLQHRVHTALRRAPVVALVGPRQVGKTTLARGFLAPSSPDYYDLEDPVDLARLDAPATALGSAGPLVVIDEVQRRPDLFPVLRVLVDRPGAGTRFLVLGSASPALLRQSSESLAGRLEVVEVAPFDLDEIGVDHLARRWSRGGFPRSYLADFDADSVAWRRNFVRTFVERDLPNLGAAVPPETMRRFWAMLAHVHGQVWSAADPARSLGVSETTVRRYLDLLVGTYMIRLLPAWHENLAKRQVRSPKLYFRDTGLLHHLLGIPDYSALLDHPRMGASWEGLALEHVLHRLQPDEAYFWATHAGAELDLLAIVGGRRLGFEFKRADAPGMTRSAHVALTDLRLDRLTIVYPGSRRYALGERVAVVPLAEVGVEDGVRDRVPPSA